MTLPIIQHDISYGKIITRLLPAPKNCPPDFEYQGDSFNCFHYMLDESREWDHVAASEVSGTRQPSVVSTSLSLQMKTTGLLFETEVEMLSCAHMYNVDSFSELSLYKLKSSLFYIRVRVSI